MKRSAAAVLLCLVVLPLPAFAAPPPEDNLAASLQMPGLFDTGRVRRDVHDIPHIFAKNDRDVPSPISSRRSSGRGGRATRRPCAPPRIVEAVDRLDDWDFITSTGIQKGYDPFDDPFDLPAPAHAEIRSSVAATIYSVWRGRGPAGDRRHLGERGPR